ncbi:MAG: formylmethanofuran dehydrogenase subunit B [Gammaproteobacteria bacterium]
MIVAKNGDAFRILNTDCPRAARGFGRRTIRQQPKIAGRSASLQEALSRAAQILRDASRPLIAGLGTDLAGCRAAVALAEKCGAVVDHMHGESLIRNFRVLQSRGGFFTTLAELKNRADVILFVGTDVQSSHPRFFERFVRPLPSMRYRHITSRTIMYLGSIRRSRTGIPRGGEKPLHLMCSDAEVGALIAVLRGLLDGHEPARHAMLGRGRVRKLKLIGQRLQAAHYAVIVWATAEFRAPHPDLIVNDICEIILKLNRTTRAGGLPMGGNDGATSWTNVCTWQSGFPSRISFASGAPEYDPHLHAARNMLGSGGADALLWISCFDPDRVPSAPSVPTILLGQANASAIRDAEVFLPAGVPGIDHRGNQSRMDGVVGLPLRQLRDPGGNAAYELLDRIRERL